MKNILKFDKENGKSVRGQYFSFDAIIASIIFVLTLVSLLSYWHSVRVTIDNQHNELMKEAMRISEQLLSPGYPPDKECDKMNEVGFAISTTDKRLNLTKIECVHGLAEQPELLKEKLGTIYDVAIKIFTYDGKQIGERKTNIRTEEKNVINTAKIRRLVSIYDPSTDNETLAYMDVYVYQTK
jgi:hypothetical protein